MGKMYIGVDGGSGGVARNVKNIYIGVNGVARKVVKGYIGVNGVARQFWGTGGGGITVDFEYNYQAGQTYSVHNYLTLENVLDACYQRYLDNVGTYPSSQAHMQYLIDHWQTIRGSIIQTVTSSGVRISNIECRISSMKSGQDPNTRITLYLGNDSFPKSVKINRQQTGAHGGIRYSLQSSPTPPATTRQLVTYVYDNSYSVGTISTASGNMNYIGFNEIDNTGTYAVYLVNFGMKVV